jgi:ketopantoate reductase
MQKPAVVIGMGEMGGVFARGLLRLGCPVYPVVRNSDIDQIANDIVDPQLVLVAVAENDLHPLLESIPANWCDALVLLQNELLPSDWQRHQLDNPTVISVWFEKKKGQDARVIIPSPAFGPRAQLIHDALGSIDIPVDILDSADDLLFELVVKNVYIITTNVAGLETGGNVGELWSQHRDTASAVANEVIAIQQAITGRNFDAGKLIDAMVYAFNGDLEHKCMGRSAPARLQRALDLASQYEVSVPTMTRIAAQLGD